MEKVDMGGVPRMVGAEVIDVDQAGGAPETGRADVVAAKARGAPDPG